MRTSNIFLFLGIAAALGLSLFGYLAWRAMTVEQVTPPEALLRFEKVRASFEPADPMLQTDANGRLVGRSKSPVPGGPRPQRLIALAYRVREQRLVRADVPFWFFRLKGPAIQFALRDTGFDLARLGVTPADLAQQGPGVVLDETRTSGDRLLVWTE